MNQKGFIYAGKPFIDMQGLGYYDNNARFLDILTGSFISVDPLAGKYPSLTPYNHCANNPLILIDPDGRWSIYVHLEKDRVKSGYGIAELRNNQGESIFQFTIRAEGIGGRNRMVENADTPLGVYDIPNGCAWISGGNRASYGPNHRLVMNPESGEIKKSGRNSIRIHGGRQEIFDTKSNKWEAVENPQLKKTKGCLRAYDKDMKLLKELTDALEKNNKSEYPDKVYVNDDLEKYNVVKYEQ